MAGSKVGYAKARLKLLEQYGGEEGLKQHYQEIGVAGGSASRSTPRGFAAMDADKLTAVAKKGGRNSRKRTGETSE